MNDNPHKNLIAWQRSMELVVGVYEITKRFPKEEIYGLSSQLTRAAISVPSNISEGAADRTTQQFSNFLSNTIGALNEIDTQLDLVHRRGYLIQHDYDRLHQQLDECLALTYGLRKSLASRSKRSQRRGARKIDPSPFAEDKLGGRRT